MDTNKNGNEKEEFKSIQNPLQEILIQTDYSFNIPLVMEDFETVKVMKIMILGKEGIHPDFQRIFLNGQELDNSMQLSDYQYSSTDSLTLSLKSISIKVQFEDKVFPIQITHQDTINSLKQLILEKTSINPDDKTFLINNEEIQDLDFYSGLEEWCTIYMFQAEFQFFVYSEFGNLQFNGSSREPISAIKEKIFYALNILQKDQVLQYQGNILDDSQNLQFYKIKENSYINLEILPIKLNVQTLTGTTFTIEAQSTQKIIEISHKIQDKEGIPPDGQRLIYAGIDIGTDKENDRLLDFGITNDSNLHLVMRLRGSDFKYTPFKRIQDDQTYECNQPTNQVSKIIQDIQNQLGIPLENQRIYDLRQIYQYGKSKIHSYCHLVYLLQPRALSEKFLQKHDQVVKSNQQQVDDALLSEKNSK